MTARRIVTLGLGFVGMMAGRASAIEGPASVPVGVAWLDITPKTPIRLIGYANRKGESDGVVSPLKVKALAIGGDDGEGPAVLLTVDNCGVPAALVEDVAARLKTKAKLSRERFAVNSSHTHCAPCLDGPLLFQLADSLTPEQKKHIDDYTRELVDAMEKVVLDAIAARQPGQLAWGKGTAGFAANRRVLEAGKWKNFGVNPAGPVDHSVPVFRVTAPDGALRAVVTGYACHCTTLGGDFNKVCGDWSDYASDEVERANPGAVSLVVIGCGADANPEPRRGLDDAKAHGRALAAEIARVLKGPMLPLSGQIAARFQTIDLPFGTLPSREEFAAKVKKPGADGFHARHFVAAYDSGSGPPKSVSYPVQTWTFGKELAMVFLGGEVVVDYANRIKRETDANRVWISAYSNAVPCYIASKRILVEGGYEADSSMIYYGQPTRLSPKVEDLIVTTVNAMLADFLTSTRRPDRQVPHKKDVP